MSANSVAAAELFSLLACFWQPPDEEFLDELRSGAVDRTLSRFGIRVCQYRFMAPSLPVLQNFFSSQIQGNGQTAILPVESLFKRWTEDPTARLPIAGSTGYLMGDSAMHVQYLLEYYNLSVPPAYRMMPDHLALLLELAAFLLKNRTTEEYYLFISQHLDWLDALSLSLEELEFGDEAEQQAQKFYQTALRALQEAVACELNKRTNNYK